MRIIISAAAFLLFSSVQAATMYSYTGNNYTNIFSDYSTAEQFDTSMYVSGSFVVNDLVINQSDYSLKEDLLSYSFLDGNTTYTEGNSKIVAFRVSTDSSGAVTDWWIQLRAGLKGDYWTYDDWLVGEERHELTTDSSAYASPSFGYGDTGETRTCLYYEDGYCTDWASRSGSARYDSGSWAMSTVVPLPAAVWLFGSALGGLGWMRRKKAV